MCVCARVTFNGIQAAIAPTAEDVTSVEITSPTIEEAFSPVDTKYAETEGVILSDEEDGQEIDKEDKTTDELCPINQEPEPTVSYEGSDFTDFYEAEEDKEDIYDEYEDDD